MIREDIAEMPITEWEGFRVRVSIDVPWLQCTATSQIILSEHELELLKDLNMPEAIKHMDYQDRHFAMQRHEKRREKAEKVLEIISFKVSNDIARHICGMAKQDK